MGLGRLPGGGEGRQDRAAHPAPAREQQPGWAGGARGNAGTSPTPSPRRPYTCARAPATHAVHPSAPRSHPAGPIATLTCPRTPCPSYVSLSHPVPPPPPASSPSGTFRHALPTLYPRLLPPTYFPYVLPLPAPLTPPAAAHRTGRCRGRAAPWGRSAGRAVPCRVEPSRALPGRPAPPPAPPAPAGLHRPAAAGRYGRVRLSSAARGEGWGSEAVPQGLRGSGGRVRPAEQLCRGGEELVKWLIYGILFPRNKRRREMKPGGILMAFPGNWRLPAQGFSGGWGEDLKLRGWWAAQKALWERKRWRRGNGDRGAAGGTNPSLLLAVQAQERIDLWPYASEHADGKAISCSSTQQGEQRARVDLWAGKGAAWCTLLGKKLHWNSPLQWGELTP